MTTAPDPQPSTPTLRLLAVPITPDCEVLSDALGTAHHVAAAARPAPDAAARQRTELQHWSDGSHRFGRPLMQVNTALWHELATRAPRTPEELRAAWHAAGCTHPDIGAALDRARAALDVIDDDAATATLHTLELLYRRGPRDVLAAAIEDTIGALSPHVVDTDADAPTTGEVYHFMATGMSVLPHGGATQHAALTQLACCVYAAAHRPLPALPDPGQSETTLTTAWLGVLATGLSALEHEVREQIVHQDALWRALDALSEAELGPGADAVRAATRDDVTWQITLGTRITDPAGMLALILRRAQRDHAAASVHVYAVSHAAPEVAAARLAAVTPAIDWTDVHAEVIRSDVKDIEARVREIVHALSPARGPAEDTR